MQRNSPELIRERISDLDSALQISKDRRTGNFSQRDTKEEMLWIALKERDPHGQFPNFVYGVRSTGIYCRLSCTSKRPRPQQVVFFESSKAAREAGFRACLKCEPDNRVSHQEILVDLVRKLLSETPEEKMSLSYLGKRFDISPFYLQRIFKRATGVSPKEYLRAARIQKIKRSLRNGSSVRKSIYDSGYNTSGWLYGQHSTGEEILGMSPSKYKSGGEGLKISHIICDSPIGRVLLGATERGVCAVNIGDSDEKLIKILRAEFPKASFVQEDKEVLENLYLWGEKIVESIRRGGNLPSEGIPLDVTATAFQQKVWKELRSIPLGSVRSYSQVAARIGYPKAARAVARACASNPTALIIPCHRVVRKNGDLGGYRWGINRKQFLLDSEKRTGPKVVRGPSTAQS